MAEFPDLDPNDDHTPESLEKTLHEYAQAVRSEFELAQTSVTPESNAEQFTQEFAKNNLANNLAQIQWLAQNSTSDGVRANCCKFLIQLAREDSINDGDPFKDLMKKFAKPQPAKASKSRSKTPTEVMADLAPPVDDEGEDD